MFYDQDEDSGFLPELEVDAASTQDELLRAKTLAEINFLRVRTEDALESRAAAQSSQYNNRVIHFNDIVDWKATSRAITHLSEMARQSNEPIQIIFHSPGGEVFSGMALFDYIQLVRESGIEVETMVVGGAFSMAGILLQAGDHRVMTPHSWMMIHEVGAGGITGTTAAIKDEAELMDRLEKQGNEILLSRSVLSVKDLESRCHRKNWWLNAEEALQYGFIDEIRPAPVAPVTKIRRGRNKKAA